MARGLNEDIPINHILLQLDPERIQNRFTGRKHRRRDTHEEGDVDVRTDPGGWAVRAETFSLLAGTCLTGVRLMTGIVHVVRWSPG